MPHLRKMAEMKPINLIIKIVAFILLVAVCHGGISGCTLELGELKPIYNWSCVLLRQVYAQKMANFPATPTPDVRVLLRSDSALTCCTTKIWNNSKTFYTTRVVEFCPCLEAPTCRVGATYASPARSVDLYAGNIGKISAWIDKFLYVFPQNEIFHSTHIPNVQHVGHAYVARTHRTWST